MKYWLFFPILLFCGLLVPVWTGSAVDGATPLSSHPSERVSGEGPPSHGFDPMGQARGVGAEPPITGSELKLRFSKQLSEPGTVYAQPSSPDAEPTSLPLGAPLSSSSTRGWLPANGGEWVMALFEGGLLLLLGWGVYRLIKRRKPGWSAQHKAECNLCCLSTSLIPLVGRTHFLRQLDRYLASPDIAVVNCVAAAGVGKTALVEGWLYAMQPHFGGAHKVFAWSFQHTSIVHPHAAGGGPSGSGLFFTQALRFFGHEGDLPDTEEKRAIRLSELLYKQPALLILDGVDPLLHAERGRTTRLADGFQDQGLYQLVRRMCQPPLEHNHANSLLVLTSQDLTHGMGEEFTAPPGKKNAYQEILLDDLTEKEGVQLLKKMGVAKGVTRQLPGIVRNLNGHALSLLVLGGLLGQKRPEWQSTPDEINQLTAPGEHGKHLERLLRHYDACIWPKESLHGIFLRLFGLFDRPMREEEWHVVRDQVHLAQPLRDLNMERCATLINDLEQAGFVLPYSDRCGWQLHPMVRDFFTDKLEAEYGADTTEANGLSQAHGVLFDYFQNLLGKEGFQPDNRAALEPLYRAVQHGCRAGRYREALYEVYIKRIRRGTDYFSLAKLGAYSSELTVLAGFFPHGWDRPPVEADLAPSDRAWLLAETAFCLTALGRVEEALGPQEEGLVLEMQRGARQGAARAAVALCDLQMATGRLRAALDTAEKGKAWAERHHLPVLEWILLTKRAIVLQRLGKWEEALAEFEEAEAVPTQITADALLFLGMVEKAHIEYLLERKAAPLEDLLQRAESAQEQAESAGQPRWIILSLLSQCRVLSAMGEGGSVLTPLFKAAMQIADTEGESPLLADILLQRASALHQQGEYHAAFRDLASTLEIARRWGLPLLEIDGRLLEGEMLLDARKHSEAEACLLRVEALIAETEYNQHREAVRTLRTRWMAAATDASR